MKFYTLIVFLIGTIYFQKDFTMCIWTEEFDSWYSSLETIEFR